MRIQSVTYLGLSVEAGAWHHKKTGGETRIGVEDESCLRTPMLLEEFIAFLFDLRANRSFLLCFSLYALEHLFSLWLTNKLLHLKSAFFG